MTVDINKKISVFSITVALISIIVSFIIVPQIDFKQDLPQIGEDITDIISDNEAQTELAKIKNELLKDLDRESQSKFYTDFCASAEEVNDSVKTKKSDLKKYAEEILVRATACRDEVEKTAGSEGISAADRLTTLKNFANNDTKKALDTAVANAEKTKLSIENEIKAFKDAEAQKQMEMQKQKEAEASNSSGTDESSSTGRTSSGSNGNNSYGGGGSYSGGSSYSGGNAYNSSDSYSESYSDSSSYDDSSSYSESYSDSASDNSGGYSDEWGGSER